jgi:hypothetical protein
MQVIALIGASYLFVRAARAHHLDKKPAQRLMIVCALVLLGSSIAAIDTETAVYFLPEGQTAWSITLGYLGLAAGLFLLVPVSLTHVDDKYISSGTSAPLMIVTLLLFVVGLGLTAVSWFHTAPIWGVRLTSFIWNAASLVVVSGISIYRSNLAASSTRGWWTILRCALAIFFCAHTIVFYAFESPYPMLMRFLELLGLIGIGAIAFWTSLALDGTSDKKTDLPTNRPLTTKFDL